MPKVVENYVFERKIGSGQFGDVYKGYNNNNGIEVAIKAIKRDDKKDKFLQLLEGQIKVLKTCNNPNIIKLYDIKKTSNNFYLILEYCNGGDLMGYLKKKKFLSQEQAIVFLKQILNAFKTLAANKIMHRDLKLANILLHNGSIKIADFGFSKLLTEEDYTKTVLGSPLSMAPEILQQKSYNFKVDIWSLGICLYELLFGIHPFKATNIIYLLDKIKNRPLKFPHQINSISDVTEDVIRRMLEVDPDKRIDWQELFTHPINSYLEDKDEFNMDDTTNTDNELAKYYLNPVKSYKKDEQSSQKNWQSEKSIKKQSDSQASESTYIIDSNKDNQNDKQSDKQKIIKSYKRNNSKLLHYRNIYALLASVAEQAISQSQWVKFSEIAGFMIIKKLMIMQEQLKQKIDNKDNFPQMEFWDSYVDTKDYLTIRNYIENQYEVYLAYYKNIHKKIKQSKILDKQTEVVLDDPSSPLPQNLYKNILKEYIKNLYSTLKERKFNLDIEQKKEYIHLSRVIDCLDTEEVFKYQTKKVIFDFKKYYSKTQIVPVDQLKIQVDKKLSII